MHLWKKRDEGGHDRCREDDNTHSGSPGSPDLHRLDIEKSCGQGRETNSHVSHRQLKQPLALEEEGIAPSLGYNKGHG